MKLIGRWNLPNVITLLGLLLALFSVWLAARSRFELGMIAFMGAGLCDLFDGLVARKLKLDAEAREFGKQLDTVVDMASFGLVPLFLVLQAGAGHRLGVLMLAVYAVCAAMRLAHFNTYTAAGAEPISHYTGLPVTYVALILPLGYALALGAHLPLGSVGSGMLLGLAVLYVLPIPIPKPRGLAYLFFPLLAVVLAVFWWQQHTAVLRFAYSPVAFELKDHYNELDDAYPHR